MSHLTAMEGYRLKPPSFIRKKMEPLFYFNHCAAPVECFVIQNSFGGTNRQPSYEKSQTKRSDFFHGWG